MLLIQLALAVALSVTTPGADAADGICVPGLQVAQPAGCPAVGPGAYAAEFAGARMPDAAPELPLEPLVRHNPVVDLTYARVATADAPVFASPAEALAGAPGRNLGRGFIFVNLVQAVEVDGHLFYRIRSGEYIRAQDVREVKPTTFQGLKFSEAPRYPVAWMVTTVRPSSRPGVPPPQQGPHLHRYTVVQIYATLRVGEWDWFMVGPNRWVEQRSVARVNINPPPEGVSGRWVQVDLYEQTLAAYEDDRLVYATLVSSGLNEWPTREGLFEVYARLVTGRMRGAYRADRSDYYFLEAVPWIMYFDRDIGLHGQYWHDGLGFRRSHGCVNLSPLDARWLFNWVSVGTPVWVYNSGGQPGLEVIAEAGP
jgi:hypothetical protein